MRTFVALEFDKNTKKLLSKIQKNIRNNSSKGRWVYVDNFHLTVKYLGNTTPHHVEDISKILNNISKNKTKIKLSLDELGFFRGENILRVVWLGLNGEVQKIDSLSKEIDNKITALGFAKNNKKYIPHITLGRNVLFDSNLHKINELISNDLKYSFNIDTLTLMNSEEIDGKRIYTPIKKFKLK